MKINGNFFALILAALVLLPGCVRVTSYKPRSLRSIQSFESVSTYRQTKSNVTLSISCLSDEATSYLFNDRAISLDGEKVTIIHASVYNLSSDEYIISPDTIGIAQIPYSDILGSIQTNTADHLKKSGKVGGSVYGVLSGLTFSVFYLPVLLGYTVDKFGIALFVTVGGVAVIWPIVSTLIALPFLGKSIKSAIMNGRIDKDLKEKMMCQDIIVPSGGTYEGLIFIKTADCRRPFTVTLPEKNNAKNSVTFEVNLN